MGSLRLRVAIIVGLIGFFAVLTTAGEIGLGWDEAIYLGSARRYVHWLDILRTDPASALSRAVITENWGARVAGPEASGVLGDMHPPLVKLAGGLTWRLFRGALGDLLAFRLAPAAAFALLLATLFLWVSEVGGLAAGLAAALFLGVMPRFFAFANMLALDAPLATLFVVATYVYWKTVDRAGWRWAVPFGILWGLALGVKNGGVLLPIGLGLWTLIYHRTWRHILRLALSGVIAVVVFVLSWPWLYYDTFGRLRIFVKAFFVSHDDLLAMQSYYLGASYAQTPWHYPLVMTAAVVPLAIFLLLLVGVAGVILAGRTARSGWLFVLSALGPMLPFLAAVSAGYDGERLFLPAFPFLAALAGLSFAGFRDAVWRLLWRRAPRLTAHRRAALGQTVLTAALAALICIAPLSDTARLHPYQLTYYSEAVGGVQGAAQRGFETTFWADSYVGVLGFLNRTVQPGQIIWADAHSVLRAYQDIGRLNKEFVIRGSNVSEPSAADWALVQARQSRFFPPVVDLMRSRQPEFMLRTDGAPLAMVYQVR